MKLPTGSFSFDNFNEIHCMLKVGLTGGIGSGKTTVAKFFELLKVPVYYADAASKRLYHTDEDLIKKMKQHFGEEIYSGGHLNRSKLAELVFNDPEKLELLNTLVHPPTIRDAHEWMQQQNSSYIIKEAALIFESGSSEGLDFVIGVSSPALLRMKRVMERDHVSMEEVQARIKRQINEEIKMRLCDFIIYNNEEKMLIPQVLDLHNKLLALASA